jgi:hypothetical protein|eukprot:SAG25_NODE_1110_length_3937_cov_1.792079_5_plen_85_part_00
MYRHGLRLPYMCLCCAEQLPGTDEEQEGRPPEVVFEFTHPSLTPPPAVTAEPPPSGVTASSGSVPYVRSTEMQHATPGLNALHA